MLQSIDDCDGKTGDQAKSGDTADEGSDFALEARSLKLNIEEGCANLAKCGCAPGCGNG
jgi:hypothetical protein